MTRSHSNQSKSWSYEPYEHAEDRNCGALIPEPTSNTAFMRTPLSAVIAVLDAEWKHQQYTNQSNTEYGNKIKGARLVFIQRNIENNGSSTTSLTCVYDAE